MPATEGKKEKTKRLLEEKVLFQAAVQEVLSDMLGTSAELCACHFMGLL